MIPDCMATLVPIRCPQTLKFFTTKSFNRKARTRILIMSNGHK